MSRKVTTCLEKSRPDIALTVFESARSSEITQCGKHDLFIRQQEEPESKRMQNKCLLWMVPMVLTVQIVAGVLFLRTTFGP
jgi:hypothetical protein